MDAPAERLAALEARVDQLETVVVALGALVAEAAEGGEMLRLLEKAAALEARYAEAGKPDAARLVEAFRGSIKKPWSFFEWLDAKFS